MADHESLRGQRTEAPLSRHNPLALAITEDIGYRSEPLPFSQYMRYWNRGITTPENEYIPGYYTGDQVRIGIDNQTTDFSTTPEGTPMYGYLLANRILSVWEATGRDPNFTIVEMGAGNGTMASDILEAIAYFGHKRGIDIPLKYTIVESSPTLLARQKERLAGENVTFIEASAAEVELPPFTGVVVTNELLDDMHVRAFRKMERNGQDGWHEMFVMPGSAEEFRET